MAYDIRSRYSYLSDKDWNRYKNDPDQLEKVNDFRKVELVEKLENFSLSENTLNVKAASHSTASNDIRIVIIGKTGQGKSATSNTILGKVRFEEDYSATSVTRESRCVTELVDGRKISVMDTPGLQDTHKSNESILTELARMTTLFPDGVHAFVYVMNMADPRFTAEDKNVLDLIEKTFGAGFKNYCLLVFSHGDSELKDVDLDTYRRKQMEIGQAARGHPTQQNVRKNRREQDQGKDQNPEQDRNQEQGQDQKGLANLLDELSWRMLAINNKTSIPFEKAHNREQIVALIDRMRTWNRPEIYSNHMFVEAQQQREAMRQKGLRKGWDPSIMNKVETILAANPSISREQLQVEVSRQLQEENLNKMLELQIKEEEFKKERFAEAKRLQEQMRVDEQKRQAEEKERRESQDKEDKERKDKFQKEEGEREERREREDRQWLLRQEQQELEKQNRFQSEEKERQRQVAEEQDKHAQRVQLQMDEWEKRKREDEQEFTLRKQHQQEMWENQFREDQQRREEQKEDYLRRRDEEESRRKIQIEREDEERRDRIRRQDIEMERKLSETKKEESERQMKRKEEEQERRERLEEEWKQLELSQRQAREEQLQQREESERRRQKQLEIDEDERQRKRKRDDKEREQKWKREQKEKTQVEREGIQRTEEELLRERRYIEYLKRLQTDGSLEDMVPNIQKEHTGLFGHAINSVATVFNSLLKLWRGR